VRIHDKGETYCGCPRIRVRASIAGVARHCQRYVTRPNVFRGILSVTGKRSSVRRFLTRTFGPYTKRPNEIIHRGKRTTTNINTAQWFPGRSVIKPRLTYRIFKLYLFSIWRSIVSRLFGPGRETSAVVVSQVTTSRETRE